MMVIAEEVIDDRVILHEKIISLLRMYRRWIPDALAIYRSYRRVGGHLFPEDFARIARMKMEEAI